jgi:superfamily II DNA or RNA helicase
LDTKQKKLELKQLYLKRDELNKQIASIELEIENSSLGIIVLKDAIYIDTTNLSSDTISQLRDSATFDNPQIKILLSLRKPLYNTPKKIQSFTQDRKTNTLILPRGLMRTVIEIFRHNNISTNFQDKRFVKKVNFPDIVFKLRKEQQKAINEIEKKDFSMCVAPPGFGKTLLGAKMITQRGVNTLVIVHKNMLLDQWIDRFIEYFAFDKKDIGYLGKGKNKLNDTLDIATMQSLKNNANIIKNYSFVIVDECHHIPAVTFEKILKKFCGRYILGLSATPNRKDGMQPLIFQQLGQISYEAKKIKTNTNKLKIINTNFRSNTDNFSTLLGEIVNDNERNQLIVDIIKKYKKRKILLLTDRIEHIFNLEILLDFEKINYISIHGSMKKQAQQHNLSKVKSSSLILATTSFFGEGVDFPHLNTIILATPISYYGRLIQYLGRVGRDGADTLAIDIFDDKNPFTRSAFRKRKDGYKQLHYKE